MSADRPPSNPPSLWQSQPAESFRLSPAELRAEADRFHRTIRRRNLLEYLASAFVLAVFGWRVVEAPGVAAKVGPALVVAATIYIVWRLYTRGTARPMQPDALAASSLDFYRAETERQRQLMRTIWRWYLGPLLPGFVFMLAESALADPRPMRLLKIGVFAAFFVLVALAIGKANQLAAEKLDRELGLLQVEDHG